MPLDPRAARFLDMAAAGRAEGGVRDIAQRRAGLARLMGFARADLIAPPGLDRTVDGPGGPIPVRMYRPDGAGGPDGAAGPGPAIVFLHGGGLVAGSLDSHDVVARGLAAASGCRLVAVDYRLAPEHPFPAALEDAAAVFRAVVAGAVDPDIDPARVALVGESGGGTLATVTAHSAGSGAGPRPPLLALICPVLDFAEETSSRAEFAAGYLIDRETLEADLADYLVPGVTRSDPWVSPLRLADLSGLPPTLVHTAEYDPLRDEGDAFAARLAAAGVPVAHHRHAGMVHNFHALGAVLPQGRAALTAIGREIGAYLRGEAAAP